MANGEANRVLALAAVFLALSEVRRIAEQGRYDRAGVQTVLDGLFKDYNGDVEQLYGGIDALDEGLGGLIDHLSQPTAAQLTRYLVLSCSWSGDCAGTAAGLAHSPRHWSRPSARPNILTISSMRM